MTRHNESTQKKASDAEEPKTRKLKSGEEAFVVGRDFGEWLRLPPSFAENAAAKYITFVDRLSSEHSLPPFQTRHLSSYDMARLLLAAVIGLVCLTSGAFAQFQVSALSITTARDSRTCGAVLLFF